MQQISYKPKKSLIVIRLLMIIFVYLMYSVFLYFKDYSIVLNLVFLLIVLFSGWPLVKLYFQKSALVISDEGITDYSKPLGFIPWSKIRNVRIVKIYNITQIELDLYNPEDFIDDLPFLISAGLKYGKTKGILPYIRTSFIDCDIDLLLTQMKMFLK